VTTPEMILTGIVEAQNSLDVTSQWKLRPGTITASGEMSALVQFDGEGFQGTQSSDVPVTSLIGYLGLGQRVMVMSVPPAGNYAISHLSSPWVDYTPELTAASVDPVLGTDGSITGRWMVIGWRTIVVEVNVTFGTAGVSAGTGQYFITPPFTVAEDSIDKATGAVYMFDSGTANRTGVVNVGANGDFYFMTASPSGDVGAAVPQTWAINDGIRFTIVHEIDSFDPL
jgi:hypothetical protein